LPKNTPAGFEPSTEICFSAFQRSYSIRPSDFPLGAEAQVRIYSTQALNVKY